MNASHFTPPPHETYRDLLFLDQTLAELVAQSEPDPANPIPWKDGLHRAYTLVEAGQRDEAIRVLRELASDATHEIRARLWMWKALRRLGVQPAPDIGQQVQGVVLEVPVNHWLDTMAVYVDGRARYIHGLGEIVVWEQPGTGNPLGQMVVGTVQAAQPLVGTHPPIERHLPPNPRAVRVSLLTFAGIVVVEDDPARAMQNQGMLADVMGAGVRVLMTLTRLREQQRKQN
jgi:hypothetical protein